MTNVKTGVCEGSKLCENRFMCEGVANVKHVCLCVCV